MYSEKLWHDFLTCTAWDFFTSTIEEKTHDIFGILRKLWVRNMCLLCKNIDVKICPFWPDLDLTSVKIKLWYDGIGSNDPHYRYLRVKWPRKHAPHGMFFLVLFSSDLWWPALDLDLFRYDLFVLTQYLSQIFTGTLCEFELSAARLTDPTAKKGKQFLLPLTWPWPYTSHLSWNIKHSLGASWRMLLNSAAPVSQLGLVPR